MEVESRQPIKDCFSFAQLLGTLERAGQYMLQYVMFPAPPMAVPPTATIRLAVVPGPAIEMQLQVHTPTHAVLPCCRHTVYQLLLAVVLCLEFGKEGRDLHSLSAKKLELVRGHCLFYPCVQGEGRAAAATQELMLGEWLPNLYVSFKVCCTSQSLCKH